MIVTGKRRAVKQRDKSLLRLSIIVSIIILLVAVLITKITTDFKNNNSSSAAQLNSPIRETTTETTIREIPASAPEQEPDSALLAFAVISDVHIQSRVNAAERFNNALLDLTENIRPNQPLVINGDLGDGTPEDYALLSRLLQPHLYGGKSFVGLLLSAIMNFIRLIMIPDQCLDAGWISEWGNRRQSNKRFLAFYPRRKQYI